MPPTIPIITRTIPIITATENANSRIGVIAIIKIPKHTRPNTSVQIALSKAYAEFSSDSGGSSCFEFGFVNLSLLVPNSVRFVLYEAQVLLELVKADVQYTETEKAEFQMERT